MNKVKLETTGNVIRKQRVKKGLLLRQVAEQLDIDTAILSKVERGERKATRDQISKLAEILELDKNAILVQFLSEKILYELQGEDLSIKALKVAEKSIKYTLTKESK